MAKRTYKITQQAPRRGAGGGGGGYGLGKQFPIEHTPIAGIVASKLHNNNSMKIARILNNKH